MIGHGTLTEAADRFGTPCYVYDWDAIQGRIAAVRGAFGSGWQISYAVKSNPNPGILRRLGREVEWLDVSSTGEARRALQTGWTAERLSLTGPVKTESALQESVRTGVGAVVLESVAEAERLQSVAAAARRTVPALLRIAPATVPKAFGMTMAGRPSAFGVEEAQAPEALARILRMPNIELIGLHAMAGSQCLQAPAVVENLSNCMECFDRLAAGAGFRPKRLVFGSGMGIPYHDGDPELDLAGVKSGLERNFGGSPGVSGAQRVLETGRYLVGPFGWYTVRVIEIKVSCGVEIALCDGGMNHNQAACGLLGNVLHRAYPIMVPGKTAEASDLRPYMVCGPLCTPLDTIARRVMLPRLEAGDLLAIGSSGAYGLSASPAAFLGRDAPREILIAAGEWIDVTDVPADGGR